METCFRLAYLNSLSTSRINCMHQTTATFTLAVLLLGTTSAQDLDTKIRGDLAQVMKAARADRLIPVTIVLREHASYAELQAIGAALPKQQRREQVTAQLKEIARSTQAELIEFLELRAAEALRSLWIHNVVGAEVTSSVVLEIAAREDVAYVHRNVHAPTEEVLTSAPALGGNPTCGLDLINAPDVWSQRGINGTGVVVAVIDTGLCVSHRDIQNRIWTNPNEIPNNGIDDDNNGYVDDTRGWNFDGNSNNLTDTLGHGSHVTGTVAGDGTSGSACGVAPGARVMILRYDNSVFTGEQSVWEAMQYAVDNGADISTASLGWQHNWNPDRATWRAVCENSIATGMTVIYSAGNEGGNVNDPDNVRTPGDVPDVITVGAVNCSDQLASFSSRGPVTWQNVAPYNDHPFRPGYKKPDVVAEGNATLSHNLCLGYTVLPGTSMSTPHVAGAAALILQADPSLDHASVKSILELTALDLGPNGNDNRYGWGRIDALAAVDMALAAGNHCPAKPNSCGTLPTIWTEGDARVSANSGFVVRAAGMIPGEAAILVYTNQGAGNTPILGGNLCVASISRAVPVQATGTPGQCDGQAFFDMNTFASGGLGGHPAGYLSIPGTTIHAQFWGRDAQNTFGSLLTGAVRYTIAP
ncbi:MAG: subtilisin family serine protease [Planctomycetota bacterium]